MNTHTNGSRPLSAASLGLHLGELAAHKSALANALMQAWRITQAGGDEQVARAFALAEVERMQVFLTRLHFALTLASVEVAAPEESEESHE